MKTKVVTFTLLPGFRWTVELYFHPNRQSASRHYGKLYPDDDRWFLGVTDCVEKGPLLARVLYYKEGFCIGVAAHEAAHVALHFAVRSGLDLSQIASEELYADVTATIVKNTLDNLPRGWHLNAHGNTSSSK